MAPGRGAKTAPHGAMAGPGGAAPATAPGRPRTAQARAWRARAPTQGPPPGRQRALARLATGRLPPSRLALIHQQHVVGVLARQPIGRLDVAPVAGARGGQIAHALQGGAHQGGPTIPVGAARQRLGHREALGDALLAPRRHWTGHRVGRRRLGRRDPRLAGRLDGTHEAGRLPTRCHGPPCVSCLRGPDGEVAHRGRGTTGAAAGARQAALTRRSTHVTRVETSTPFVATLSEVY
jgi:hypothetical protein